MVKCPRCAETFDRNSSDVKAVKIKNRWWHESCNNERIIEEQQKKQDKLLAQGSDEQRKKLYQYICEIFGLKGPGPKNIMLINSFYEKYGYTYSGIYKALYYHYEIKKGSTKKADERIGIVPYVYDDAMEYFRQLEHKKTQLGNQAQNISQEVIVVTVVPRQKVQPRKEIDINSL